MVYLILLLCDYNIDESWIPIASTREYTIWRIDP